MIRFLLILLLLLPSSAFAVDDVVGNWVTASPVGCDGALTWCAEGNTSELTCNTFYSSGIQQGGWTKEREWRLSCGNYSQYRYMTYYLENLTGPYAPTEPETCLDGVVSGAETGIDCGDSLCIGDETCSTYCPVGFAAESRQGLTACYSLDTTADYTVDAVLGACPSNMFVSSTDSSKCVSWALPTWADSDYLDTPTTDAADTTPWNNVFTQDDTTYDYVTDTVDGVTTEVDTVTNTTTSDTGVDTVSETITTTVTNVDGTQTITTITTNTINNNGTVSGITETIIQQYDSAGSILSETGTSEEIGSTEEAGAPFGAPDGTALAADDDAALTGFVTRYTEFTDAVSASPLMSPVALLFAGPDTSGKDATFSLDMGSYGVKSASLSNYDAVWSALGYVFMFLAVLAASRMVMVKGA